jgi:hypothetical protein
MNTIIQSNGEILTGKSWRKQHSSFHSLPFHSNLPRMVEMAGPLQATLSDDREQQLFCSLLVVSYVIVPVGFHYPLSISRRNLARGWMMAGHFPTVKM